MTKKTHNAQPIDDEPQRHNLKLPRCEYCGTPFIPTGPKQKYCSDNHRQAAFQERKKREQK